MSKEEKISFLSTDGKTTIHAVKWMPEDGSYHAILQITHGMIEFIERYKPFADYLTERGFMVVGHDHLGHGGSITTQDDWGYMSDNPSDTLVADMHQLRTIIQKDNEGVPYFMMAHSMGSYMLRKYLTIHNDNLRGAIIMGTGTVPDGATKMGLKFCKLLATFFGWRHRSKLVEKLTFGGGAYKKYNMDGTDPSNSWLTKDAEIVKAYYAEPRCTFKFTLNGYYGLMEAVYYDNQLENVKKTPKKLPLFFVSGQDDPVGDCGAGVKHAYDLYMQAGVKDLTYKLYENDRHEILNETDKEKVFADIHAWMEVRIDT